MFCQPTTTRDQTRPAGRRRRSALKWLSLSSPRFARDIISDHVNSRITNRVSPQCLKRFYNEEKDIIEGSRPMQWAGKNFVEGVEAKQLLLFSEVSKREKNIV